MKIEPDGKVILYSKLTGVAIRVPPSDANNLLFAGLYVLTPRAETPESGSAVPVPGAIAGPPLHLVK